MEESENSNNSDRRSDDRAVKKIRVTMYLDAAVIDIFRRQAAISGAKYQPLINEALRHALDPASLPVTAESLRRVVREELARYFDLARSTKGP